MIFLLEFWGLIWYNAFSQIGGKGERTSNIKRRTFNIECGAALRGYFLGVMNG
jgi:hypothetical protein